MPTTLASELADFAAELSVDALPDNVVHAAQLHSLDTIGCGLAGVAVGAGAPARAVASEAAGSGHSTVIGESAGMTPAAAAFANAAACHALDFDDTHTAGIVHISAALVPAVLAVGEDVGASGADVIVALTIGTEIVARLGMWKGLGVRDRGFHPTSVLGVLGVATAVGRLYGLDHKTAVNAIGIAGSMASGLLGYVADGSSTKHLNPAWAAMSGITAVRLAVHGATGPDSVVEGRYGVLSSFADAQVGPTIDLADLGRTWETTSMAFKPYPASHYMAAPLEAIRRLVAEEDISADVVEEIVALVPDAGVPIVLEPIEAKRRPVTGAEAKFSLPYSLAAHLVRGSVGISTYTDDAVTDEEVRKLAAKVRYEVHDYGTFPASLPGGVRVLTTDGRVLQADVPHQPGSPTNPMTDAAVVAKFHANAGLALPKEAVAQLAHTILELRAADDLTPFATLGRARTSETDQGQRTSTKDN
ncbi:MmgE/PrpD family protein [Rhodococcus sp. NCIMB 12038]|uniref:MmgE/PrpD family protein n=1 Tax=Rhodococcus sp. NCIMB 12038 TaxID=933800 RepID=UPI000B3C3E0B|nr:MmgE/PrpD family protein [Rhodococcus sp. NCIMB 12038]OUS82224.1 hypothetical protein CA951_41220 [Rhodococcus sp. NCIMB 12038]